MRVNGVAMAAACGVLFAGCSKGGSKDDGGDYWLATREDGAVMYINRTPTSNVSKHIRRAWILSVFDPYRKLSIITHRLDLEEFNCNELTHRVTSSTIYHDDGYRYSVDTSYEKFLPELPESNGMMRLKLVCEKAAYIGLNGQTSDAAIASANKSFRSAK